MRCKRSCESTAEIICAMIEYCVAGHHSGLPDGGTKVDGEEDSTLHGRMKRKTGDYSAYENEVKLEYPKDNLRELF